MSDPLFKFEYGLSRKIRYCGKRRNFFDGLHRFTLFVNAVSGSSAFVSILANWIGLAAALAATIAIISAIDNVIGFSEKARMYADLRSKYYDIYCDFIAERPEKIKTIGYRQRRLLVDRDMPPPMKVLDVIARNEEDIARGFKPEDTIYIAPARYFLRQLIDLPPSEWRTVGEVKGNVSPPTHSAPPVEVTESSTTQGLSGEKAR